MTRRPASSPARRAVVAAAVVTGTSTALVVGMLTLPSAAAVGSVSAAGTTTSPTTTSPTATPTTTKPTPTPTSTRPTTAQANARIARALAARVKNKRLGRTFSVRVVDVSSGAQVYARNIDRALLPASNNKLVTAVTALQTLGPRRRFPTSVRLDPLPPAPPKPTPTPTPTTTPTSSPSPTTTSPSPTTTSPSPTPTPTVPPVVTTRTVHLVAGGDPLLSSANLRALAATTATAMRARGVTRLKVALDDTLFPRPTSAPGWVSGYQPYVVRPVRALVRDWRTDWDVADDAVRYFTRSLAAAGIRASYVGRSAVPARATTVASYRGHSVSDAVVSMMLPSDNQIAEMLYRQSALASGRAATWAGGAATARAVLTAMKVPLTGVRLSDGSGVSRTDRLTARALTTVLLRIVDRTNYPRLQVLYFGRGMPVAGRTGTLASRYQVGPSRCARGVVLAKTGTLHDVVALSGVTVGTDRKLKVFSVLLNGISYSADKTVVRRAVDGLAATVNGCW